MRRIAILFGLLLSSYAAWGTACPTGYTNAIAITVLHDSSLSADVTNWALPFVGSNAQLKTVANGGLVQSAGTDIVPCTAASGGTIIPYEMVANSYSATAGTFEMWVNWPTISKTTDQVEYLLVGKASATDFSCGTSCASVFPNCLLVYHMGYDNGTTSAQSLTDSCGNATSPTNHGSTKVDNVAFPPLYEEVGFNSQWFDTGYTPGAALAGSFSLEHWIMNKDSASGHSILGNTATPVIGILESTFNSATGCTTGRRCLELYIITNSTNYKATALDITIGTGNTPHLFAVTHTGGSAAVLTMYLDGATGTQTVVDTTGSATDPGNSGSTFQIGKGGSNYSATWNPATEALDEFHLYNATLSANQAKIDYDVQNNPVAEYTIGTAFVPGGVRHKSQVF